jgi:hypothetical protein
MVLRGARHFILEETVQEMNRAAVAKFAACAREDLRRLAYHVRGFFRSIFQRLP